MDKSAVWAGSGCMAVFPISGSRLISPPGTAPEHPLDHSRICVARFCILFPSQLSQLALPTHTGTTAPLMCLTEGNLSLLSLLKKGATSREGDNSIHHHQGRSNGDALPPSPTRQFVHCPSSLLLPPCPLPHSPNHCHVSLPLTATAAAACHGDHT